MLMLDEAESAQGAGPMFVVESVEAFHAGRPAALRIRDEPQEIPGGSMATYEDPSGHPVYVLDQAQDSGGTTGG